jgi:hypothetical protein
LLDALSRYDAEATQANRDARQLARRLILVSALIHDYADERRTAEYLLRNRADVASGRRSPESLLSAARCAAEMDCRRLWLTEVASTSTELANAREISVARIADPSVPETVVAYLDEVVDRVVIPSRLEDQIITAVTIALEVSRRHALNNGQGPSVIAMRTDARREGRLVTHLREEFGRTHVADVLSRILVGPDGSPIDTSLLWWAAQGRASASFVPRELRQRWAGHIGDLSSAPEAGDDAIALSTDDHFYPYGIDRAS